jgi:hypothetical protein
MTQTAKVQEKETKPKPETEVISLYGGISVSCIISDVSTNKAEVEKKIETYRGKEAITFFKCQIKNGNIKVNIPNPSFPIHEGYNAAIKYLLSPVLLGDQTLDKLSSNLLSHQK